MRHRFARARIDLRKHVAEQAYSFLRDLPALVAVVFCRRREFAQDKFLRKPASHALYGTVPLMLPVSCCETTEDDG